MRYADALNRTLVRHVANAVIDDRSHNFGTSCS